MAGKFWAGLDVGVVTTSVCVMQDDGRVLQDSVCPSDLKCVHNEIRWLKRRRNARVGLEAGVGVSIARGLRSLGYAVDIYEARQLSKFLRVRRNKTDAGDAAGIAEAGRIGAAAVSKVYLKSLDGQALQSRLTLRRHLIRERVAAVSLLSRQIELYGGRIGAPRRRGSLSDQVEPELKKLFGRSSASLVSDLRQLVTHCETLIDRQTAIDEELERVARNNDVCRRWMRIPGIGPICSLTFYALVGDPSRFASSEKIGVYLGLTPRLHQSGLTKRSGRISRMGSSAMRGLLVQASMHFMRSADEQCELRRWALEVEKRRGRRRAKVALARRLAIMMLAMWKRQEDFEMFRTSPSRATVGKLDSEVSGTISNATSVVEPTCQTPENITCHLK